MTVDELVQLTEALLGDTITVRQAVETWSALDDEELALLVRFVAGERPETGPPPRVRYVDERPATPDEVADFDRRLAALDDERTSPDPLQLDGSFDGVTLP